MSRKRTCLETTDVILDYRLDDQLRCRLRMIMECVSPQSKSATRLFVMYTLVKVFISMHEKRVDLV